MKSHLITLLIVLFGLSHSACKKENPNDFQLVIVNASLLDVDTGEEKENQSVFIKDGIIVKIKKTDSEDYVYENVINANGRLLTPSFVDVHNHLNFVFGDTTVITNSKEFKRARELITHQYMPFGVTVVRSAGGREEHIPMERSWMEYDPSYIDYYPTGGAFVSIDTKFYNHTFQRDSMAVVTKIKDYHNQGIRHIKVYSLLGKPQLQAALKTTDSLGMNIFGHIENSMISIESATKLGLKNFEHVKTLFLEVIRNYKRESKDLSFLPPDDNENWQFREYEIFNYLGDNDPSLLSLIDLLKSYNASITPTLHIYAQPIDETTAEIQFVNELKYDWPSDKIQRAKRGYNVLSSLVYKLYKKGITLNTGSDTNEPGKTILSEMLLLNKTGIPMHDVIKIASINSAKSMGLDSLYGSIEQGKRAHLILFKKSPLNNPLNLLSEKMVIKDGVIWKE